MANSKKVEEKKSKKGIVITILVLILIILGLVGYICYEKGLIFKQNKEVVIEIEKERKIDLKSRTVRSLYSNVTTGDTSCRKNWIYDDKSEFKVKDLSNEIKMRIVGNMLSQEGSEQLICEEAKFTQNFTIKTDDFEIPYASLCQTNSGGKMIGNTEPTYTKEEIETYYKLIFGKDAKLDTSVDIFLDPYKGRMYRYTPELDKYVMYERTDGTGGTCGPVQFKDELEKATMKGNVLKIYEKETVITGEMDSYDDNGNVKHQKASRKTYKYVYTFEQESDGMYKFISRLKVKK